MNDALPYGFRDTFAAFLEYEASKLPNDGVTELGLLARHATGPLAERMRDVADAEWDFRLRWAVRGIRDDAKGYGHASGTMDERTALFHEHAKARLVLLQSHTAPSLAEAA